jgi:hypothetical protein
MPNLDPLTPGLPGQCIKLFVILLKNLLSQRESFMTIIKQDLPLIIAELGDSNLNTKPRNVCKQNLPDLPILKIPTFVQNRHKCIDDIDRSLSLKYQNPVYE